MRGRGGKGGFLFCVVVVFGGARALLMQHLVKFAKGVHAGGGIQVLAQ